MIVKVNCHTGREIRHLLSSGSPDRFQASLGIDEIMPKLQRKVARLNVNSFSCRDNRLEHGGGGGLFLVSSGFANGLQV